MWWARVGAMVRWTAVTVVTAWVGVRVLGVDAWYPAVQLMAFTPYVAGATVVAAPLLWLRRRYPPALALAFAGAVLAAAVVPRMLPDPDPLAGARGPAVRVASANLLVGAADAAWVVRVVREQRVDVLAVQELTQEWLAAADRAGLGGLLPQRHVEPEGGAGGTAIFARVPFREAGSRHNWFLEGYAVLALPGGGVLRVESAHAASPYNAEAVGPWRTTLRREPAADGSPRVLLGDFNATLDHGLLRELIGTGYRDAADVVGAGLVGTWPYEGDPVPPVTLDHVLADRRIGVRSFAAYPIPGSDHRMVVAELVLPNP